MSNNADIDINPIEAPVKIGIPGGTKDSIALNMLDILKARGYVDKLSMYGYDIDIGSIENNVPDQNFKSNKHLVVFSRQVYMWNSTQNEFLELQNGGSNILINKTLEQEEMNICFEDSPIHDVIHNFFWRSDNTVWYAHTVRSILGKPEGISFEKYTADASEEIIKYIDESLYRTDRSIEEFIKNHR